MVLDIVTVGDSVVDIMIPVPRFPKGNEDSVSGEKMERQLGGASNFLLQASRLGLAVGITDCVGDDEFGRFYKEVMKSEGVDVSRVYELAGFQTARCIVLVDAKGNHAYIGFPGATKHLTPDEVEPAFIQDSKVLYVSGYTLADSPLREAVIRAVNLATEAEIPLYFDPSPIISRIPEEMLKSIIAPSEAILLNEREIASISGTCNNKEAAQRLLRLGPETIILKLGSNGCLICNHSGFEEVPSFHVNVVDTTGAGDTFNASFIFGQLNGWTLRKSAIFANAIGAITVTKMGAGANVPTKKEVIHFLSENNVDLFDF